MDDDGNGGSSSDDGAPAVVVLDRRTSGLRPFRKGDGRAVEAGRRGGEAAGARRRAERADAVAVLESVRTLATRSDRELLGPACVGAALEMIGRVSSGEQRVPDPAAWLRALVDVARLEAGEATSASIVAHLGAGAAAEVVALRDRARAQLGAGASSSVLAADDPPSPVVDAVEGEGRDGGSVPRVGGDGGQ